MQQAQKVTTIASIAQVKELLMAGMLVQDLILDPAMFKDVDDGMFQHRLSQAVKASNLFEESLMEIQKFNGYVKEYGLHYASREFEKFLDCGGFSISWLKDLYLASMEELEDYILSA